MDVCWRRPTLKKQVSHWLRILGECRSIRGGWPTAKRVPFRHIDLADPHTGTGRGVGMQCMADFRSSRDRGHPRFVLLTYDRFLLSCNCSTTWYCTTRRQLIFKADVNILNLSRWCWFLLVSFNFSSGNNLSCLNTPQHICSTRLVSRSQMKSKLNFCFNHQTWG